DERRGSLVVVDRPDALGVGDRRVQGSRKIDREGLRGFGDLVPEDRDFHGGAPASIVRERGDARREGVVRAGGRVSGNGAEIRGRVVNGWGRAAALRPGP